MVTVNFSKLFAWTMFIFNCCFLLFTVMIVFFGRPGAFGETGFVIIAFLLLNTILTYRHARYC